MSKFPLNARCANLIFYRSYSRLFEGKKETFSQVCDRVISSLEKIGKLTVAESALIDEMQRDLITTVSGRWMWIGGSKWLDNPENTSGGYNCSSQEINSIEAIASMMELAATGTGTGASLEQHSICEIPLVSQLLNLTIEGVPGTVKKRNRNEETVLLVKYDKLYASSDTRIIIGDSRKGWIEAYKSVLMLAMATKSPASAPLNVVIDLSHVRPTGERIEGFGGEANPSMLGNLFVRMAEILNKAHGRKLNSIEICKLIDEASLVIVVGNVRRSAGMRQFSSCDPLAASAKDNLWIKGEDGKWSIDPDRACLRMANHTIVHHKKPDYETVLNSVTKQYYSGEGAIQWAGEAIARASADILQGDLKVKFLSAYNRSTEEAKEVLLNLNASEIDDRMKRYKTNPCALGSMELLTVNGYQTFETLNGQDVDIINAFGQVSKSKVWCSGIKETIKLTFEGRSKPLICTPDHKLMDIDGNTVLAANSKGLRLMPFTSAPIHDPLYVAYGIVQGDGILSSLQDPNRKGIRLCIGAKDTEFIDVLNDAGLTFTVSKDLQKLYINNGFSDQLRSLGFSDKNLPERKFPLSFGDWTVKQKKAFLNGVFTANGCVHSTDSALGRISLKGTCKAFIDSIQSLLAEFKIESYITVNKPKVKKFNNGEYLMKQSYDLNIQQYFSRSEFSRLIGFSLSYKSDLLIEKLIETAPKVRSIQPYGLHKVYDFIEPLTHWGVVNTIAFHNCGEIVMHNNFCNLSAIHANQLDPTDFEQQKKAFKSGGLIVASLLHDKFSDARFQKSREIDPIVGVSITGLFDFFVKLFGVEWLKWWEAGRPEQWKFDREYSQKMLDKVYNAAVKHSINLGNSIWFYSSDIGVIFTEIEQFYLSFWRSTVSQQVSEYCNNHGLKIPNRVTTIQPHGSVALLTNACPGWHPPKAAYVIRRITYSKGHPIALAAIDKGYNVIPGQQDKDENGALLDNPFDPRCTEWLIEVPIKTDWADLKGADKIDVAKFGIKAQYSFYMQVQKYYTEHNTSGTMEITESEIPTMANLIHQSIQNDNGFVSTAILAKFESLEAFPRMPFEPISKAVYEQLCTEINARDCGRSFNDLLTEYGAIAEEAPAGCDSGKCILPEIK